MKILCAVVAILFFAVGARAETTNVLSDAEIQGRQLAQHILEQQPAENSTNNGTLTVQRKKSSSTDFPIKFAVIVTTTNWQSIYEASGIATLSVIHAANQPNKYFYQPLLGDGPMPRSLFSSESKTNGLSRADLSFPFAGSDFWICDLGLEFFHWPAQKILKKEVKRSQGCTVLESTNPNPSTNGYSRVVSWIDGESLGIVQAYAYDANGKKIKEFYPDSLQKVNGQYQVSEMEMDNVQTGSRTRLEFDFKK
jgi:hypothetical protein